MKRALFVNSVLPAIALLAFFVLSTFPASADDPKAREIMKKVEARDDGDNMTTDLSMILIDKRGQKRVRQIRSFSKDFGEDSYQLMLFVSPADVKNTGFLTYDYDDAGKNDDQWLYLPALKKTKRIANDDKTGSFMGSDFTYFDMTKRELADYDFKLLKEPMVNGVKTWLIESVPRSKEIVDKSGYKKSVLFVRQDNYVVIRSISWMLKDGRLKYMNVKKLERIDNIWIATETSMTTKKGKSTLHKTVMKQRNVKYGQDLDKNLFTIRRLEKGL